MQSGTQAPQVVRALGDGVVRVLGDLPTSTRAASEGGARILATHGQTVWALAAHDEDGLEPKIDVYQCTEVSGCEVVSSLDLAAPLDGESGLSVADDGWLFVPTRTTSGERGLTLFGWTSTSDLVTLEPLASVAWNRCLGTNYTVVPNWETGEHDTFLSNLNEESCSEDPSISATAGLTAIGDVLTPPRDPHAEVLAFGGGCLRLQAGGR